MNVVYFGRDLHFFPNHRMSFGTNSSQSGLELCNVLAPTTKKAALSVLIHLLSWECKGAHKHPSYYHALSRAAHELSRWFTKAPESVWFHHKTKKVGCISGGLRHGFTVGCRALGGWTASVVRDIWYPRRKEIFLSLV